MSDLLIEFFSEEIPARMQARAAADLQKLVTNGLVEAGLTYAYAAAFHTSRRLTLTVGGLLGESPTQREERKGPRTDAPDKALEGFLRSTGLNKDQLEARDEKKGQVWFAVIERPGRAVAEIVAEVLDHTIRNFPWPKSMRWAAGTLRWVRPLHSILCLLSDEDGAQVVPLTVEGLTAGNTTAGHRFMAPNRFSVMSFEDYEAKLKYAKVLLRADERTDRIWIDAHNQALAQGLEVVEDKALLAEVAGLVEWPVVLMGDIGSEFMDLPPEVLQTSMRKHQKFFSVRNPKFDRIEKFVTVANIETADHGTTILAGNQKVLSARLSDAKFFWKNDLCAVNDVGLEGMVAPLAHVTFHNKLGSQADRIARIEALARDIAPLVDASPNLAAKAARVAKADLASEMVYEFPELQGIMGRYYSKSAHLPDAVALACEMHYKPLGPSDEVPTDPVSVAVAFADKIDTLTGFWAIDEKPTGSKDPYALRRTALGVIRLVLHNQLRANIVEVIRSHFLRKVDSPVGGDGATIGYGHGEIIETQLELWMLLSGAGFRGGLSEKEGFFASEAGVVARDILAFFHDRLKFHLRDEGIRHDVIDACLAMPANDDLTLLVKRATALAAILKTDDGENLLQGFKRTNNILAEAEQQDAIEYSFGADIKFAEDAIEKELFSALDAADFKIKPAMDSEDFETAMHAMAALRAPIDAFFNAVEVNSDSQVLRRNRLNLLHRIRAICLSVADLTRIEG